MPLKFKILCGLFLLASVNVIQADMWFNFPEGSPLDWGVRSGPSYAVFPSPWLPEGYQTGGTAPAQDNAAGYGERRGHFEAVERIRKGIPLIQFQDSFNPLNLAPSDFYLESANGGHLVKSGAMKELIQSGVGGFTSREKNIERLLRTLKPNPATPEIHFYYDTFVSAIYMNIETMNDREVILLRVSEIQENDKQASGIKMPEPFYFSKMEGMAQLIEYGFISARGSVHDIQAFGRKKNGAAEAHEVLRQISGLENAPENWMDWVLKNQSVTPAAEPKTAENVQQFLTEFAHHQLSRKRYYNYDSSFGQVIRTLPDIFLPTLIAAVNHEESLIRRNAVALIGDVHDDQSRKTLLKALEHDDAVVRHRAAVGLRKQWQDSLENSVVKALAKADDVLKVRLLQLLGQGTNSNGLDGIKKYVTSKKIDLKVAALRALIKRQQGDAYFIEAKDVVPSLSDPVPFIHLAGKATFGDEKNRKKFLEASKQVLKRIYTKSSWQAWKKYTQDVKGPENLIEAFAVIARLEDPGKKWLDFFKDLIVEGSKSKVDPIHPAWRNAFLWELGRESHEKVLKKLKPALTKIFKTKLKDQQAQNDSDIFIDTNNQFKHTSRTFSEKRAAALFLISRIDSKWAQKEALKLLTSLVKEKKKDSSHHLLMNSCLKIISGGVTKKESSLLKSILKNSSNSMDVRSNCLSPLSRILKPVERFKLFSKIAGDASENHLLRLRTIKFLGLDKELEGSPAVLLELLVDENPEIRFVAGVTLRQSYNSKNFVNPYGDLAAQKKYQDNWQKIIKPQGE